MLDILETTEEGEIILGNGYSVKKAEKHELDIFEVYLKGKRICQFGYLARAFDFVEEELNEDK